VLTFAYTFSLAYLAATLLSSGVGHLFTYVSFRTLVGAHRIIPLRWAPAIAAFVVVSELGGAGMALASLVRGQVVLPDLLLFAAGTLAGLAFTLYLRRLLAERPGIGSCGCSPLGGPLTPVSLVPATFLLLVSLAGMLATAFGLAQPLVLVGTLPPIAMMLPVMWGVTLAGIVILLPATAPTIQPEGQL
jgi:hypothetical protein